MCTYVNTVYTVYIFEQNERAGTISKDFPITLSAANKRPMYQQIIDQVGDLVRLGVWPAGEKLPSIREFAAQAKVSLITVKRAYLDLERMGLIVTQHGLGSWVADQLDREQLNRDALDNALAQVVAEASALGIGDDDLITLLEATLEQRNES